VSPRPRLALRIPDGRRGYLVVALAGLLVGALLVAIFVFPPTGAAEEGTVPTVIGLAFDEAEQKLELAGFKARMGESRNNATAPKNTVIAQLPPADSRELRGTEIVLDVSAGEELVEIPSITGLAREAAAAALEGAGLAVGRVTEKASEEPRGAVIGTNPAAGKLVPASAEVDLVLSSGPAQVTAPDVVGQNYAVARAMLEQLGLALGEVTFDSTAVQPPNTIIAQSPAAGASVPPGTRIDLRVSGGAP
jgi:beta-lactam-binding protein with PASTA domain